MDLSTRLKDGIASVHQDIEALEISKAMVQGTISQETYIDLLCQLRHIHETLESQLDQHSNLQHVYQAKTMARTKIIDQDLKAFNVFTLPEPINEVAEFQNEIKQWSATEPISLIGALYVLEGSRMGSMFLAKTVAKALGLAPQAGVGLDYHIDGMAARPRAWSQFKMSLDALSLTTEEQNSIVARAIDTMRGLYRLYEVCSSEIAMPVSSTY